jgi:hypothetical protein
MWNKIKKIVIEFFKIWEESQALKAEQIVKRYNFYVKEKHNNV